MRKPIVVGNWKMNKSGAEAVDLAMAVNRELADSGEVDVGLCPPFTALAAVSKVLASSQVRLGAQNMHWEKSGAYTGEISAAMLRDLYCHYVILGHSERRACFHETDEDVNRKVKAALEATLVPIVCVGETLAQREAGAMADVVRTQVTNSMAGLGSGLRQVVVAYEPVWAIGTGRTATPAQAQEVHALIRKILGEMGGEAARAVRIQYGGSVKAANAVELFSQPDIDGGLIGGAALDAVGFIQIVKAARPSSK